MKLLLRIIFTILIQDAIIRKVIALTNETNKEHEVLKMKISNKDGFTDSLIAILVHSYALLILIIFICICKICDFIQLFYTSFRNLWRYFIFWFFRVILRTHILETPPRIQVSEMECVYIVQNQEEITDNLPPNNEEDDV